MPDPISTGNHDLAQQLLKRLLTYGKFTDETFPPPMLRAPDKPLKLEGNDPAMDFAVQEKQGLYPELYKRLSRVSTGLPMLENPDTNKPDPNILGRTDWFTKGGPAWMNLKTEKNPDDATETVWHELSHVAGLPDTRDIRSKFGTDAYDVSDLGRLLHSDINLDAKSDYPLPPVIKRLIR